MNVRRFTVDLGARSYPILIGRDLLTDTSLFAEHVPHGQVFLLTNNVVGPLYLDRVRDCLGSREVVVHLLADGEQEKNLENFRLLQNALVEAKFHRDCAVVALGGGVVGDLAGFVAACYQRGVDFIQLPTTLLAQVDSSVGGKTAVNHPRAKNIIGAFHQPQAVLADVGALDTLPDRELRAGIAEVIKYGAALDADFFGWLESHMDRLVARDPDRLITAIGRCCELKARLVAADEREAGQRALLNFGHTFGHAIEAVQGYGEWLHGEAVAAGMVTAATLSTSACTLSAEAAARIRTLVAAAGLPTELPGTDPETLHAAMAMDKKVAGGKIRFVLLDALGQGRVVGDVDERLVDSAMRQCQSRE